jgi:hypothetical protein
MEATIRETKVDIPEQFLVDLLTTAFEGGINHWCSWVKGIKQNDEGQDIEWHVKVQGEPGLIHLNLPAVVKAMEDLVNTTVAMNPTVVEHIRLALFDQENMGCYVDADVADVVVQVALFGDLVYA